jgi:hypothetical protein
MTAVRVPGARVIAGHGLPAMPPSFEFLRSRWTASDAAIARAGLGLTVMAALHLAALGLLLWSEVGLVAKLVFAFSWGLLNFFWLALLRRPAVSAALSLATLVVLILLSRLKYEITWMTANFLGLMIVNADTVSFLLAVKPDLARKILLVLALVLPALTLIWWTDVFRIRLRTAATGLAACAAALLGISIVFPQEEWDTFVGDSYVSKFARSGVAAISEYATHGYMESDAAIIDRLRALPNEVCAPWGKPPHIVLVHDESSFDIRALPGIKVAAGSVLRRQAPPFHQ